MEKKDKKKTLTISSNLKKKIDTSSINAEGKKSFSVEKKKPFKVSKSINRSNQPVGHINNPDTKDAPYRLGAKRGDKTLPRIMPIAA